jgi:hypothetical protein
MKGSHVDNVIGKGARLASIIPCASNRRMSGLSC